MKKSLIALLVAICLAATAVLCWYQHNRADARQLMAYGNVDYRQVSLAFNASGRIEREHVEEGDHVVVGQVLAQLDTRMLALQVDEAKAQWEQQQQNVARLHAGSRPEEIAQSASRVQSAQAEATRAHSELKRLKQVAASTDGRGVSAQDIDNASSSAKIADAKLADQREALRLSTQGPRKEEVAAALAALGAAKAHVAKLQQQLDEGVLRSPVDATVRSRLLEPGDMASPQKAVFNLALTSEKWIRIYVDEVQLGRVAPGMAASVVSDNDPDHPFNGRVGYISSVAEFTPKTVQTPELRTALVYEVRIRIEDHDNRLRLGQPVTVIIDTAHD